ncbi:hypothetical protein [Sphingomonas sp. SAFR-052]|uniref:hypothetical protein n=1 Tax=Sphingomonas sp. SAFR-052 TaxID=3436867 RepID=UPI003F804EE0
MTTASPDSADVVSTSRALPLVCAVAQILTPFLPMIGFGRTIGAQSNAVRTLVTPAGWAFAIWGALYTGALVFAIYQALPSQRDNPLLARLRGPAAGAFFGNALWAAYTQVAGLGVPSVAIILFTLLCLLKSYRILSTSPMGFTTGERWCAVLPLTALASWLTVASIVNIAATLRAHGVYFGGETPVVAAAIVVLGGVIAAAALVAGRGCPPYALVFFWALSAIWASGGQRSALVAIGVVVAALLVLLGTITGLRRGGLAHWLGQRPLPMRDDLPTRARA